MTIVRLHLVQQVATITWQSDTSLATVICRQQLHRGQTFVARLCETEPLPSIFIPASVSRKLEGCERNGICLSAYDHSSRVFISPHTLMKPIGTSEITHTRDAWIKCNKTRWLTAYCAWSIEIKSDQIIFRQALTRITSSRFSIGQRTTLRIYTIIRTAKKKERNMRDTQAALLAEQCVHSLNVYPAQSSASSASHNRETQPQEF